MPTSRMPTTVSTRTILRTFRQPPSLDQTCLKKKPRGRCRGAYQQGFFTQFPLLSTSCLFSFTPNNSNREVGFMATTGVEELAGAEARIPMVIKTSNKHQINEIPQSSPPLNPGQLPSTHLEHTWDINKPHNHSGSTNLPDRSKTLSTYTPPEGAKTVHSVCTVS